MVFSRLVQIAIKESSKENPISRLVQIAIKESSKENPILFDYLILPLKFAVNHKVTEQFLPEIMSLCS